MVVDEAPTGRGYGAAAIKVISRGRLTIEPTNADASELLPFTTTVRMTLEGDDLPDLPCRDRIASETEGLFPSRAAAPNRR